MIIFISLATLAATLLGGFFALRFKDKLHLVLGFSAGAVIGVAFFDLLPEAIELGGPRFETSIVTTVAAFGFVLYMILDRFIVLHTDHDHDGHNHHRGTLSAGSLSFHSFLDGLAIGLAFQVSQAIGMIVAVAVLVHDFSDGINTVNFILKSGGSRARAIRWLIIDALAPVVGVLSTLFFKLPAEYLGLVLATFCGFFLYIGASELLPESHHGHPTKWTTIMTVIGIIVLYIAIRIAG
ncbi:MAG: hypothetical protein A3A33_00565 [Candidatus Yanofskybacteria bacterium RIFCSPLOWO2_01_FULL_49_25]|uniref:Permease n=1 Tax=Candidatus Yanofskybacteria bacterium RIFCSPLOWO2_01_FULL_49_25 TaxID=1802701 RepID=A0A1F8GSQ3_9BACT|nr:MAG: hypothetical protein A3A33_00565 [Candidatus Yanofskybacteria bacterium RIFCSPLOWO2_01_FULL_49_25]